MPTFRITAPNGKTYKVTGPDGSTAEQALAQVKASLGESSDPQEKGYIETFGAAAGKGFGTVVLGAQDLLGRGVSAAGRALTPSSTSDLITGNKPTLQRVGDWLQKDAKSGRAKLAEELAPYAEANPITAKAGEITGEAVPTMLAGSAAGNVIGKVAPRLGSAISTGGMTTGGPAPTNLLGKATDLGIRSLGGGINGAIAGELIDPESAAGAATVGALLPGGVMLAGKLGNAIGDKARSGARSLMQSALKPTLQQLKTGEADTAVETLLKEGLNPTARGVEKLRALVDDRNTQIANRIAGANAFVDKQDVLNALAGVRQKFGNQVSPTADLNAIQRIEEDFLANQMAPGKLIPVQKAQALKQGTYSVLKGKYGQLGSAETEAQKALARGLKDEIAAAVPGVGQLNAEESRLLTTLNVAERRALMDLNKNPMGLAALSSNPVSWAAFMADKSAAFKALAARALNAMAEKPAAAQNLLGNQTLQQIGYRAAPIASTSQ